VATNGPDTESRPLRIVQITDTHLYSDHDGRLLGLNTRHSLEQVIDLVLDAQQPDLVVASGDLTHDGSPQAYRYVRDCFQRISAPVYCLPGNHDETAALNASMNSDPFLSVRSTRVDNWQMLFLDSTVAGSEDGHLGKTELDALDATLASSPDLPTLIWLHHQPVPIGSRWLDSMAVDNPQAFFDITDRYAQVRAIIWGHVHQLFEHNAMAYNCSPPLRPASSSCPAARTLQWTLCHPVTAGLSCTRTDLSEPAWIVCRKYPARLIPMHAVTSTNPLP